MIDTIIGERSFSLHVTYIEFESQIVNPEEDGQIPIIELSSYIEWRKTNPK